jgi:hypothetical protein
VNAVNPLMKLRFFLSSGLLALVSLLVFSCNEKEEFTTEALQDYYPITVGKYITYRVDSMVFVNFGGNIENHYYQERHMIDSMFTDNLGHTSYRVFISQRDSAGVEPWHAVVGGTYYITPLSDRIEVVSESNFRLIKMHLPLRDGYSWKGNKYLPDNPYGATYNFSNDDNMADWDYYYDGSPSSFSYKGHTYNDVYSIEEADESYNVPIVDLHAYAARTRAVEKYSKNIGLVYKELELWEFQPNPGGASYRTGFGITLWMIDHN